MIMVMSLWYRLEVQLSLCITWTRGGVGIKRHKFLTLTLDDEWSALPDLASQTQIPLYEPERLGSTDCLDKKEKRKNVTGLKRNYDF
jgi:hypothetical protein